MKMPSTSFQPILDAAFADYAKQTGIDPTKDPFADRVQACHSPDDVLKLLEEKANEFKDYREGNRKLIHCIKPVVNVVHAFSGVLGEALSLVSPNSLVLPVRIFTSLPPPGSVPTSRGDLRWRGYSPCGTCPLTFYDYTTSPYPDAIGSQRCQLELRCAR